jgi:hypothetical protein
MRICPIVDTLNVGPHELPNFCGRNRCFNC